MPFKDKLIGDAAFPTRDDQAIFLGHLIAVFRKILINELDVIPYNVGDLFYQHQI